MDNSPKDRFYRIVEHGMCIGCGLCQSVAGPGRVRVRKVASGYERPVVVGPLDHATVDRIYATCPGTRVGGLPARLAEGAHHDLIWGPYRRMVLGWAGDPAVRHRGATGGVLTALGQFLLRSGRVDFVLHARPGRAEPTFGERHVSVTEVEVLQGAGSRYGPTAPLVDFRELLDRRQPFAFIGKPCDTSAIRNYAEVDSRVGELLRYCLAMVCGGYMPPADMDRFLRGRGIDPAGVTAVSYRGNGCPGPTRIETADGRVHDFHYLDFWGEDADSYSLPMRCKFCPDAIGEAADLAAADCWPGGAPDRVGSETDPGTNALVIRTAAGLELVEAAVAEGALVLGDEVKSDFMNSVQPHQIKLKFELMARLRGLAAEGRLAPRTARLRVEELGAANDPESNREVTEGTRRRVREGRNAEERPA